MRERTHRARAAAPAVRGSPREIQELMRSVELLKSRQRDIQREEKTFKRAVSNIAEAALLATDSPDPEDRTVLREAMHRIAELMK